MIPAIELQSLAQQEQYQLNRLQQLLQYLQTHSPFYRQLLQEQGMDPASVTSLQDLELIPCTTKEDLQNRNFDFLCVGTSEVAEYTCTTGTTGSAVTIALTQADRRRLAYNELLSFGCMNLSNADVCQLMLTMDRQFMAGMAYYSGLEQLGAAAIRTGPGLPAMQWETIERLQTTVLVAVPSFLLKMLDYAATAGINTRGASVKKVLAIGESLRDASLQPNALARRITEQWDIELYSTYAATEIQAAFTECGAGQGGHMHPELVITELLDDAGRQVSTGEPGEVTITTLGVTGMPLLRYRTGDICRAYTEPCSCGRHTMRLGPVLGRKQQMIKLKGTSLFPPAIFEVLQQCTFIKEYVVDVFTDAHGQDDVLLLLTTHEAGEQEEVLKNLLKQKLRVTPKIEFITEPEMQRLQFPPASRKQIRFRDRRTQVLGSGLIQ
jgi:phenylacetate-CoA ligase